MPPAQRTDMRLWALHFSDAAQFTGGVQPRSRTSNIAFETTVPSRVQAQNKQHTLYSSMRIGTAGSLRLVPRARDILPYKTHNWMRIKLYLPPEMAGARSARCNTRTHADWLALRLASKRLCQPLDQMHCRPRWRAKHLRNARRYRVRLDCRPDGRVCVRSRLCSEPVRVAVEHARKSTLQILHLARLNTCGCATQGTG